MRSPLLNFLAIAVALVPAACGDTAVTTVPPGASGPAAAVEEWAASLAGGDPDEIGRLVAQPQLALLVGIDNGLPVPDLAALARGGLPIDLAASYWASFGASFAEFAEAPLADLAVGEAEVFAVDERRFASVRVSFPERIGSSQILAVETAPERWQVDLLATLGPALLTPLRSVATQLPAGEDGDAVRALLTEVLPSLRAAAEQPENDLLGEEQRLELEALVRFLAPGLG